MKLSSDRSLGRIRHPELTAKLMEICRGYPRSRIDLLGGQGKGPVGRGKQNKLWSIYEVRSSFLFTTGRDL